MGISTCFTCCFKSPTTDSPELDQTDHPSNHKSSKSLNPFKLFSGNHGTRTVTNSSEAQIIAGEFVQQKEAIAASINQSAPQQNTLSANYHEGNGTMISSSIIYSEFPAS
ncbi:MAG: hypothetical protein ACRCST_00295 [Turicibacter sp.]